MNTTLINLEEVLLEACKRGRISLLRIKSEGNLNIRTKDDSNGGSSVVTRADTETEQLLRDYFKEQLPEFNFLGEEEGSHTEETRKAVIVDPLDCTKGFLQGLDNFGLILGVYVNGINVAGAICDATRGTIYYATHSGDLRRYGPEDQSERGAIYFLQSSRTPHINDAVEQALREEFPDHASKDLIKVQQPHVLNQCRVFAGRADAFFHAGLARHDIAAAPLFGRITNTLVTDHAGKPYELVDVGQEIRKYRDGRKEVVYSLPVVVAKQDIHVRMLRALKPFSRDFDKMRSPIY